MPPTRNIIWVYRLQAHIYAGHSLRRGGATSLHARGVSDQVIMLLGRWRSDCFRLYMNASLVTLQSALKLLSNTRPFELADIAKDQPCWSDD